MNIREQLFTAFPTLADKALSDDYIIAHSDLIFDPPDLPLIQAVPLYMLWCIDVKDEGELVIDDTIVALNKYARAKNPDSCMLNFKFKCNQQQIDAIKAFLQWCNNELALDYEPTLSRAIKNWQRI